LQKDSALKGLMQVRPLLEVDGLLRSLALLSFKKTESEPNPMIAIQANRVNLKDGTIDISLKVFGNLSPAIENPYKKNQKNM